MRLDNIVNTYILLSENLEAKRPYLKKEILKYEEPLRNLAKLDNKNFDDMIDELINWIGESDPISFKTKGKKTPFVNTILKWALNGGIELPEDIETARDTLQKYQEAKNNKGFKGDINKYRSLAELRSELVNEVDGSYDANATLVDTLGEFKMYRIDNWNQGKICFADSGWCVQHEGTFDDYGPPYHMILKGRKRYALMHAKSGQLKDVHDKPLTREAAKPILPFVKRLVPAMEKSVTDFAVLADDVPEIMEKVKRSPKAAIKYARDVIKGRWPEGEEAIKTDAHTAYSYAKHIIKGRWPEGEKAIKTELSWSIFYARDVIKGRWLEAEEAIKKEPLAAHSYAVEIIRGRWPEGEKAIKTNANAAMNYAIDIIGSRWPEAEEIIKTDDHAQRMYTKEFKNSYSSI